jgi:hypothetical protein
MNDDDVLIQLAKRLGTDPPYISWLIRLQLESRPQTWEELAAALGLTPRQLALLALCRRPRREKFKDEVAQIAAHVQMNANDLAVLLNEWQSFDTFRQPTETLHAAARDGKGKPEPADTGGDDNSDNDPVE